MLVQNFFQKVFGVVQECKDDGMTAVRGNMKNVDKTVLVRWIFNLCTPENTENIFIFWPF